MSQERLCKNQVLSKSVRVMFFFFCVDSTWNYPSALQSSPLIGPGLVSTSPANNSNRDSARHREKLRGLADTLPRRVHAQHRTSLPREKRAPFPASHPPVATFPASQSSSRTHKRGASEITCPRRRCRGTRGRDPQCTWYHRSFLFSQWPILARHSSGPFGGIFEISLTLWTVHVNPNKATPKGRNLCPHRSCTMKVNVTRKCRNIVGASLS